MILRDGTEIEIGTYWEINVACCINIVQSPENINRWHSPNFVGIDLTREQAEELCKKVQNALKDYDKLEKSLEEYHAKPDTDE